MRWLEALGAGLAGAVMGLMLWIALEAIYIFVIVIPQLRWTGSGGLGAVSVGILSPGLLTVMVMGFCVGLWWWRRRGMRRALKASSRRT